MSILTDFEKCNKTTIPDTYDNKRTRERKIKDIKDIAIVK